MMLNEIYQCVTLSNAERWEASDARRTVLLQILGIDENYPEVEWCCRTLAEEFRYILKLANDGGDVA